MIQFAITAILYLTSVFFGILSILLVIDIIKYHKTGKGLRIFKNAQFN